MDEEDHRRGVSEWRQNVEQLDVDVVVGVSMGRAMLELLLLRTFVTFVGEGAGEGEEVEKFDEKLHQRDLRDFVGFVIVVGEFGSGAGRSGERERAVGPNTRLDL